MKNQNKLFGRNKYLNPVIIDGNDSYIGKIEKVYIENFNKNSLSGKILKSNIVAA